MSFVAIASKAQVSCDMMSLIINNQGWTNTYIQLHHPGCRLINPNSENIISVENYRYTWQHNFPICCV